MKLSASSFVHKFDAFGNLIAENGSTPNSYLYSAQQRDLDLGLDYNRARYLNTGIGRFWTMDGNYGNNEDPLSLHKYLYTQDNPVNQVDPQGHDEFADLGSAVGPSVSIGSLQTTTIIPDGLDSAGVRITGSEPDYDPSPWDDGWNGIVQPYNNCYAYAVNNLVPWPNRGDKSQPGYKALGYGVQQSQYSVSTVRTAAVEDGLLYLGTLPSETDPTPPLDYVIALVVDPGNDYHWYRHDRGGMWSHKPGADTVKNTDASSPAPISDPRSADSNYGPGRNYRDWGGYFAVPPNMQVLP